MVTMTAADMEVIKDLPGYKVILKAVLKSQLTTAGKFTFKCCESMVTMTAPDMEVIKDLPGYKVILKAVLKSQLQQLIEQLASVTNEESIILMASGADGTLSHLGSDSAKGFLEDHEDVKSQFLGYCLKIHHRKSLEAEPEKQTDQPNQAYVALLETTSPYVSPGYGKTLGRGKIQGKGQTVVGDRHQPYARPGKKSGTTSSNQSVPSSKKATPSGDILPVKQEPLDDLNKATPSGDLGSVKLEQQDDSNESGRESFTCRSVGTEIDERVDDDDDDSFMRIHTGIDNPTQSDSNVNDMNGGVWSKASFLDTINVSVKTEVLDDTDAYVKLEVDHASHDRVSYVPPGMNFDPTGATGSQADMTGKQGYKVPIMRICTFYNVKGGCRNDYQSKKCPNLHLCKHYVVDACKFGKMCKRSHNLTDQGVLSILEKYGIETKRTPQEILADLKEMFQNDDGSNSESIESAPQSVSSRTKLASASLSENDQGQPFQGSLIGPALKMEDTGSHEYTSSLPVDYSSAYAVNDKLGSVELFICEVCGDILPPDVLTVDHMKTHSKDGFIQCPHCDFRIPELYQNGMRRHAARFHPRPVGTFGGYMIKYRPWECSVCQREIYGKRSLGRHIFCHYKVFCRNAFGLKSLDFI